MGIQYFSMTNIDAIVYLSIHHKTGSGSVKYFLTGGSEERTVKQIAIQAKMETI